MQIQLVDQSTPLCYTHEDTEMKDTNLESPVCTANALVNQCAAPMRWFLWERIYFTTFFSTKSLSPVTKCHV